MNVIRFLFSKWFLINLAIASAIFLLLFFLVNMQLAKITNHGQQIEVPELRGFTIDSIDDLIAQGSFRIQLIDSLYDETMEPGAILLQNPLPGSKVKENRRIYLTINTLNPPMIELPALINKSARQVEATIGILGLKIKDKVYRDSPYNNLVLDVLYENESVGKGAKLPLDARLSLVIGNSGRLPMVNLPNLLNHTASEADSILRLSGLELGIMVECEQCMTPKDSIQALIYRSSPQYKTDKKVRLGSTIDFWATTLMPDTLILQ